MAHEIDFSNKRANMAYVGETPWHSLGAKLPALCPVATVAANRVQLEAN